MRAGITLLATVVTLVFLLGLALLAGRGLEPLLMSAVDDELDAALRDAASDVEAGVLPAEPPGLQVRVLDTAGDEVLGSPPAALDPDTIRTLKAGLAVTVPGDPRVRWHGTVVTAPDGSQRLVVAGAGLVGVASAVSDGSAWLLAVASVGAVVAGLAIWLAVGAALRPMGRMLDSLRRLRSGERLAMPRSVELRALAGEVNRLLDRESDTADRLRRFTGDAAHELRSPVASIRVQSEVAVANPDADLGQEVLADVLAEAVRLSSLLDGLLALARSDAGELPPATEVDLVSEVRAAAARVGNGIPDGPQVRVNAAVNEVWASAAHGEVELILDNLLRNSCRFARAQVVVSVLGGRGAARGQGVARVVVDDDGPGIAAEHRERVFDRFYRVADDRARDSGGAGLGLALVAELVRRRGGSATAGESPDGGARFQVTWPSPR